MLSVGYISSSDTTYNINFEPSNKYNVVSINNMVNNAERLNLDIIVANCTDPCNTYKDVNRLLAVTCIKKLPIVLVIKKEPSVITEYNMKGNVFAYLPNVYRYEVDNSDVDRSDVNRSDVDRSDINGAFENMSMVTKNNVIKIKHKELVNIIAKTSGDPYLKILHEFAVAKNNTSHNTSHNTQHSTQHGTYNNTYVEHDYSICVSKLTELDKGSDEINIAQFAKDTVQMSKDTVQMSKDTAQFVKDTVQTSKQEIKQNKYSIYTINTAEDYGKEIKKLRREFIKAPVREQFSIYYAGAFSFKDTIARRIELVNRSVGSVTSHDWTSVEVNGGRSNIMRMQAVLDFYKGVVYSVITVVYLDDVINTVTFDGVKITKEGRNRGTYTEIMATLLSGHKLLIYTGDIRKKTDFNINELCEKFADLVHVFTSHDAMVSKIKELYNEFIDSKKDTNYVDSDY